jgi:hypothetical protein
MHGNRCGKAVKTLFVWLIAMKLLTGAVDAPQPSIRISGTKYKPMPGCPALETTMTLLIHISG